MAAAPAWIPISGYIGQLPDDEDLHSYDITSTLPANTTEIQIYAYISVQGLEPSFERGYYTVYTESLDGKTQFACYLNVAKINDTVLNSDNFWLPYGEGIKPTVFMQLKSSESSKGLKAKKPRKKSTKGDMKEQLKQRDDDDDQIYGEAFLSGYKVRS